MEIIKKGLRLATIGDDGALRWWYGDEHGWLPGEAGAVPLDIDQALEVMGRLEYKLCALLLKPKCVVAGDGGDGEGGVSVDKGNGDEQGAGAVGGTEPSG